MSVEVRPIPATQQRQFFSAEQRAQVEVLLETLWPGQPDAPGARVAGAADYVDWLLGDATVYFEIPDWRAQYTAGLAMLAGAAATRFARPLQALNVDQATELVGALAGGTLTGFPSADWQRSFFALLRAHAIEGCLADPRWGGNKDAVVWRWLGYPAGPAKDYPFKS